MSAMLEEPTKNFLPRLLLWPWLKCERIIIYYEHSGLFNKHNERNENIRKTKIKSNYHSLVMRSEILGQTNALATNTYHRRCVYPFLISCVNEGGWTGTAWMAAAAILHVYACVHCIFVANAWFVPRAICFFFSVSPSFRPLHVAFSAALYRTNTT